MDDLFTPEFEGALWESVKDAPLALRMRPQGLEEFRGQEHILGVGKMLKRAILADRISSLILYGPPGCGKTALAYCIARRTKASFSKLNAVTSNVNELRDVLQEAKLRKSETKKRTILFVDEIHRFNKAQQDALTPDVEEGNVILIGATTHNPFFSINSPLLSRSQVFELKPIPDVEMALILKGALENKERGLGNYNVKMEPTALQFLIRTCEGDARRGLNALEIGVVTTEPGGDGVIHFTLDIAVESIQKKVILYDKDEDAHYDTISAFIKSMRGGDPDSAIYWLAKMIEGGEDPRFIARRIVICAAEDVGNADPQALILANSALQVSEFVGLPEARIPLAQATIYVATAPKSNSSYLAIEKAMEDVRNEKIHGVPEHLKDASYRGAEKLGHGAGYKYPHSFKGHFVKQEYAPLKKNYYEPSEEGFERVLRIRLAQWRRKKGEMKGKGDDERDQR